MLSTDLLDFTLSFRQLAFHLSGNDTGFAAETGSGKIHGYLVPRVEKLHQAHSNHPGIEAIGYRKSQYSQMSLILCPNVMLCEQVVRMANSVR